MRTVPAVPLASLAILTFAAMVAACSSLGDAGNTTVHVVGGTIIEEFQTPLAHVNVAARPRGTPNLAYPNAFQDPKGWGRTLPHGGEREHPEDATGQRQA